MSFLSDVGHVVSRTFANPTKLIADISSGGLTAVLRALPRKLGGGQSGIYSKATEAFGGSVIGGGSGFVTGFATGGPVGAIYGGIAGGAAGLGRGISGAVHGESGKTIAAGSAKWGALSGIAGGGAARVVGAVGKTAVVATSQTAAGTTAATVGPGGTAGVISATGATAPAAAGAPIAAAAAGGGGIWSSLGTGAASLGGLTLLSLLQRPPGQPPGSGPSDISVLNSGAGPGVDTAAAGPWQYPAVSGYGDFATSALPMGGGKGIIEQASTNTLLLVTAGALVALFFLFRKHH